MKRYNALDYFTRNNLTSSKSQPPLRRDRLNDQYVSHNKSREDFSPWRSAREDNRISFNPPSQSNDIREDPRYTNLKDRAFDAEPYHKQMNDLQMRRFMELPPGSRSNMVFDYTLGNDTSHQFNPKIRSMRFNANDIANNPLVYSAHENQHGLSFLDKSNRSYQKTLTNMKDQNLDQTQLNTVKKVIGGVNFMNGYKSPVLDPLANYKGPKGSKGWKSRANLINKNNTLADEFGAHIVENAVNPILFRPGQDAIKPFLSKEVKNIQDTYRKYDRDDNFPTIHQAFNDLQTKISKDHPVDQGAVSIGQRDTQKKAKYLKRLQQKSSYRPEEAKEYARGGRVPNRSAMFFDIMQELLNRK